VIGQSMTSFENRRGHRNSLARRIGKFQPFTRRLTNDSTTRTQPLEAAAEVSGVARGLQGEELASRYRHWSRLFERKPNRRAWIPEGRHPMISAARSSVHALKWDFVS
jgi:hypothetical protein